MSYDVTFLALCVWYIFMYMFMPVCVHEYVRMYVRRTKVNVRGLSQSLLCFEMDSYLELIYSASY